MDQEKFEQSKVEKFRIGIYVLGFLAVITIGEFGIAQVGKNLGMILMLIAILKAFFVLRDYMHMGRLFSEDEVSK